MDTISYLIDLARVQARLDKRCLLGRSTVMDVPARGVAEAVVHFVFEGECTLEVANKTYALKAGDAALLPMALPHRIRTAGGPSARGVSVTAGTYFETLRSDVPGAEVVELLSMRYTFRSAAGPLVLHSLPNPLLVPIGTHHHPSGSMIALLRKEVLGDGEGTYVVLSALCLALLAVLLRQAAGRSAGSALWTAVDDARIEGVIDAVLRDPAAAWPTEKLAEIATMSRSSFMRHFPRLTGVQVGVFVVTVRMIKAADLLSQRDLTVASIAAMVGYRSVAAFRSAFARVVGTTPGRFRREYARQSIHR
jgi:AraC family transcriptional activator of mtrCDE